MEEKAEQTGQVSNLPWKTICIWMSSWTTLDYFCKCDAVWVGGKHLPEVGLLLVHSQISSSISRSILLIHNQILIIHTIVIPSNIYQYFKIARLLHSQSVFLWWIKCFVCWLRHCFSDQSLYRPHEKLHLYTRFKFRVKFHPSNKTAGRVNKLSGVLVWGKPPQLNTEQVKPVRSVGNPAHSAFIWRSVAHVWNTVTKN